MWIKTNWTCTRTLKHTLMGKQCLRFSPNWPARRVQRGSFGRRQVVLCCARGDSAPNSIMLVTGPSSEIYRWGRLRNGSKRIKTLAAKNELASHTTMSQFIEYLKHKCKTSSKDLYIRLPLILPKREAAWRENSWLRNPAERGQYTGVTCNNGHASTCIGIHTRTGYKHAITSRHKQPSACLIVMV